jgi:hypothetical protein
MPICQKCSASFDIHPEEHAFLQKIGFRFGDTVIHPKEPILCPDCRLKERTCHRNERFLHWNRSALSGKEIITLYATDPPWGAPYEVYAPDEWHSDQWDPMTYGRPFDVRKSFFEQWAELHKAVPRLALVVLMNENCDYVTNSAYCKNCYLINSSEYCEDCFYGKLLQNCKNCADCSYLFDSELCYDCFSVYTSYNCTSLSFSTNCTDCHFSSHLIGCRNCILCTNLHQKEYHVENKPVRKEEYQKFLTSFQGSHKKREEMKVTLQAFERKHPKKYANILNAENCTGDYIENSRNCIDCYDLTGSEDCRYVHTAVKVKDNVDCSNMYLKVELCYQTLGAIEAYNCAYCLFIFYSRNLLYCEYCLHCSDCFGCNGLQRKQYCIFNKQYSKEKYEELVPKIIEHMEKDASPSTAFGMNRGLSSSKPTGSWGRYFPPQYAPFGYNETVASEYFPLSKEEALKQGFHWRDTKDDIPKVEKVIPAELLPDRLDEIPDDVLNWAITCEVSKRPYRIQKPELSFYRKMHIPIPHKHPDTRYDERLALRNPRKLFARSCGKCGEAIQTTYAQDRSETVYCEECYVREVY